jgi:hypothetical protein
MKKVFTIPVIYTLLSATGAALFLLATGGNEYTMVDRVGGALWVFLLSMIILMPAVAAWRSGKKG